MSPGNGVRHIPIRSTTNVAGSKLDMSAVGLRELLFKEVFAYLQAAQGPLRQIEFVADGSRVPVRIINRGVGGGRVADQGISYSKGTAQVPVSSLAFNLGRDKQGHDSIQLRAHSGEESSVINNVSELQFDPTKGPESLGQLQSTLAGMFERAAQRFGAPELKSNAGHGVNQAGLRFVQAVRNVAKRAEENRQVIDGFHRELNRLSSDVRSAASITPFVVAARATKVTEVDGIYLSPPADVDPMASQPASSFRLDVVRDGTVTFHHTAIADSYRVPTDAKTAQKESFLYRFDLAKTDPEKLKTALRKVVVEFEKSIKGGSLK